MHDIICMMIWNLLKSDYLKLLPILILAFYLAFIPHQSYPYTAHGDEWAHQAFATELIDNGGTEGLTSPITGGTPEWNQNVELGFHIFWGVFQKTTGVSWAVIIKYSPAILFLLTVLSVYVLSRRIGAGWQSALFACIVPTEVGILGPGFFVPVAMGMLFITLALFITLYLRGWQAIVMLFIFSCFLVSMHAATAIILIIILMPFILLNIKKDCRYYLFLVLALVVPFVFPLPWIYRLLIESAGSLFTQQPLPSFVDLPQGWAGSFGYLPIAIFAVGIFSLVWAGGSKNYGLVLGVLFLIAILATFSRLHYGIELIYLRGLVYLQLMMAIIAGFGLEWFGKIKLPDSLASKLKPTFISKHFGEMICLILIIVVLAIAIPVHQNTRYYRMIDQQDYEAFVWIAQHLEVNYDKAILDPWKATAFTAITGRKVYTRLYIYLGEAEEKAYEFLDNGCVDTTFLEENGILIIYNRKNCENPDLINVRRHVYLLHKPR